MGKGILMVRSSDKHGPDIIHVNNEHETFMLITPKFPFGVGLHQGFTLSLYCSCWFWTDRVTNVQDEVCWCMMFVDDVVLLSHARK